MISSYLTDKIMLRNAFFDYNGDKNKESVNYLKGKYKGDKLWMELKGVTRKLKLHNLTFIIDRVKSNYKLYKHSGISWLKDKMFKLANPIKIKGDCEFCMALKSLQNSGSGNLQAIL
jgi:hypothetical protein